MLLSHELEEQNSRVASAMGLLRAGERMRRRRRMQAQQPSEEWPPFATEPSTAKPPAQESPTKLPIETAPEVTAGYRQQDSSTSLNSGVPPYSRLAGCPAEPIMREVRAPAIASESPHLSHS